MTRSPCWHTCVLRFRYYLVYQLMELAKQKRALNDLSLFDFAYESWTFGKNFWIDRSHWLSSSTLSGTGLLLLKNNTSVSHILARLSHDTTDEGPRDRVPTRTQSYQDIQGHLNYRHFLRIIWIISRARIACSSCFIILFRFYNLSINSAQLFPRSSVGVVTVDNANIISYCINIWISWGWDPFLHI